MISGRSEARAPIRSFFCLSLIQEVILSFLLVILAYGVVLRRVDDMETFYNIPEHIRYDGRWFLMEDDLCWKETFGERQPFVEDNPGRRRPSIEDDLWWKAIFEQVCFDGRQPLMEDELWWKTTFYGRRPFMEDNVSWKTTFDGKRPSMEDNLWWKMTFDGSWPLMEEQLWW